MVYLYGQKYMLEIYSRTYHIGWPIASSYDLIWYKWSICDQQVDDVSKQTSLVSLTKLTRANEI